jgi:replication factor A1
VVTCEEAKQLKSGINVQGKIVKKDEIRNVNTKFGETKVCDAYLIDDSGSIQLTLWDKDTEKVNNGDMVSLEGGYTTIFRNQVQLNKSRKDGKLEIILDRTEQSVDESPPPDESAKVKKLEQQLVEIQKALIERFPSSPPDKKEKQLTDKKAIENQKSDLEQYDLCGVDLRHANLVDAKLSGAKLNYADLRDADLTNADLYGTVLCEGKLDNADFTNADISYADFTGVKLARVDLSKVAKNVGVVGLDLKKTGRIEKGHSKVGKAGLGRIFFRDRTNEY